MPGRLFEHIVNLSVKLHEFRFIDDLLWYAAQEVVGKLGFVDCVIYLYDPGKQALVRKAAVGEKNPDARTIANPLEIPLGAGITGAVAKERETLIIGDLSKDPRYITDLEPAQSEICVPMIIGDNMIGVIDCDDPRKDHFGDDHQALLETVAGIVATKIEALLRSEELERINEELKDEITQRRVAEQALVDSLATFQDYAKAANDWTWEQDAELRFTHVSAYRGIPFVSFESEILGKTRWEVFGVDLETDEMWRKHAEDLYAHRPFKSFVYDLRNESRMQWTLSISGVPIFEKDGTFKGYRGTATDVTELVQTKSANDRFLRAIDHVGEGFALWGPDERLVMLNARMRELSGLPDEVLKPGLSFLEWINQRFKHDKIPEILSEREKWISLRVELMRSPPEHPIEVLRDGRWYQLQYLKLEDGSTVQSIIDIDDKKAAEKAKDQFIATVSHELRTPLTSIIGALDLIHAGLVGKLPQKALALVEVCKRNANRLLILVNDILDLEAISDDRLEIEAEPASAMKLLFDAAELNEPFGKSSGVTLDVSVSDNDFCVHADRRRVQQIFANLISNAVKFSDEGSSVELGLRQYDGLAAFSVTDRGSGIPEDFLPRLYERFVQADGSDARKVGGSGLGLSITKSLVEMHGGSLTCTSEVGIGTTFTFTLPLAEG